MNFPMNFICAGNEYATIEKPVAAPLLRKNFELAKNPEKNETKLRKLVEEAARNNSLPFGAK